MEERIFSYPGREMLVKSILLAMTTHFLTVLKMPKGVISYIDKFRRGFLWRGTDHKMSRGTLFGKLKNVLHA
jgi:hypothetical protein